MDDMNAVQPQVGGDAQVSADTQSAGVEQTQEANATEVTGENQTNAQQEQVAKTVPYERLQSVIQERNQMRAEFEQMKGLVEALKTNPQVAQAFLQNVPQAQTQDPVLAEADNTLRQMGYVRSEDVSKMVSQEIARKEAEREFIGKMESLKEKYNGKDGMPAFDPMEIAKHMDETGIADPERAWKDKYLDQIVDAKAKGAKKPVYSEKSGQPMQTAGGDDRALYEEAKATGDFTKLLLQRVGVPAGLRNS